MSKTLLVTDDAMIIREMIKEAARDAGWEIAGEATNGHEAIEQFDTLEPDAVTLDLVMPEYDGIHALKGIMQRDSSARVLVVSALEQTEILKQAIQLGARDFIVKPFSNDQLRVALAKIASTESNTSIATAAAAT